MSQKPKSPAKPAALRRRAEARLKARAPRPQTDTDPRRQQHELEVHQIELELQHQELQAAQAELQASLTRHTEFYDFAPVGFLSLQPDGTITHANRTAVSLLGLPASRLLRQHFEVFVPAPNRLAFAALLIRTFESETPESAELPLRAGGDSARMFLLHGCRSVDGRECRLALMDITERKRMERAMQETEKRFTVLADAAPVMLWESDENKLCNYFNRVWLDFTGRPLAQELGHGWAEGVHPEDLARCLEIYGSSFDTRREFRMEYRLRRHDGEYRWILDNGVPRHQADGTFAGYIGSCMDITERKQMEAALRASLEEKTVLLKEVHHRVKNNLQIVSSLLDLQERRTQDDQLLDTLASTRNRVRSMALIHEKLYQTNNLAHLDLASYLETLCRQLHSSAGSVRSRVRIESWVTPPTLAVGLDQAVPCGLVINELVTNALKYAFPGERAGRIQVSLQRPAPREVLLTVADDGVGWPAALDPGHTVSLGLKLVFLLTDQLHGTVTFERASGTAVQIRFPNPSDPTP